LLFTDLAGRSLTAVLGMGPHFAQPCNPLFNRRMRTKQVVKRMTAKRVSKKEMCRGSILLAECAAGLGNFFECAHQTFGVATLMVIWPTSEALPDAALSLSV